MCTAVIRYTRLIVFVEIEPSLCLQIVCTAQFSSRNGTALLYTPPVATQLNCYSTVRRTIVIALALRLRVARRWRPGNATTTPLRRDATRMSQITLERTAMLWYWFAARHTALLLYSTQLHALFFPRVQLFFVLRSLHAHIEKIWPSTSPPLSLYCSTHCSHSSVSERVLWTMYCTVQFTHYALHNLTMSATVQTSNTRK